MKKQAFLISLCLAATMQVGLIPSAQAEPSCAPLPASVQNISVSYISKTDELNKLDETLSNHLQPCLEPLTASNSKAICTHGRVNAEQVLRVVSRVDEAGKHNAFLANAKMKSYKAGVGLLERMKSLSANHTCH